MSFKNAMIILTSNVGSRVIASAAGGPRRMLGASQGGAPAPMGSSSWNRGMGGGGMGAEEKEEAMVAAEQVGSLVLLCTCTSVCACVSAGACGCARMCLHLHAWESTAC